jgi:Flp pilus assembly protein TadG
MTRESKFMPGVGQEKSTRPVLARLAEDCGSTLVEYAVTFILFMTMLLGIAGFGLALYAYHFVSNTAREATRYAAVRGSTCADDGSCTAANSASGTAGPATPADLQTFVTNVTPQGIDSSKITTTPSWPVQANSPAICNTTSNAPGCTVEVEVDYSFNFIFPLISSSPLTLSSTSEMVIVH